MSSSMTVPSNPSEDRGPGLRAVAIILTLLSVTTMSLRLYVRSKMVGKIGVDDWTMLFVTVFSLVGTGLIIAGVKYGTGRHIGDVPQDIYSMGMKLNFISQIIYLYGICFAKLAVGALLLRIASTKFWRYTIIGSMIFVFLYTTGGFSTIVGQCTDIRVIWDPSVKSTCWTGDQIRLSGYINFSLNIVSDVVFALIIPISMLWNINVSHRTKLSLIFILSLGCLVCACAMVRITYLDSYGSSGDWLWDTVDLAMWSVIELNVGIIAGSLPSLRPLFRQFLGSVYGSGSKAKKYEPGDGMSTSRHSKKQKSSDWAMEGVNVKSGDNSPPGKGYGMPLQTPVEEREFDDSSSQRHLHDAPSSGSLRSFELETYGVEARVTANGMRPPTSSLSDDDVKGIRKTTHTTVSYDDARFI